MQKSTIVCKNSPSKDPSWNDFPLSLRGLLYLSCVPQLVMSLRFLKLLSGVEILSLVLGVILQSLLSPLVRTWKHTEHHIFRQPGQDNSFLEYEVSTHPSRCRSSRCRSRSCPSALCAPPAPRWRPAQTDLDSYAPAAPHAGLRADLVQQRKIHK